MLSDWLSGCNTYFWRYFVLVIPVLGIAISATPCLGSALFWRRHLSSLLWSLILHGREKLRQMYLNLFSPTPAHGEEGLSQLFLSYTRLRRGRSFSTFLAYARSRRGRSFSTFLTYARSWRGRSFSTFLAYARSRRGGLKNSTLAPSIAIWRWGV